MLDLAKEIWQTMRTNKLRTFLTGFSVAWGIFILILLLAVSKGVLNGVQKMSADSDPYRITIWGGYTSLPYKGMKEGRGIQLQSRDFEPIKRANQANITDISAELPYNGLISTNKDYLSTSCNGVYPKYFTPRFVFTQGRPINDADISSMRKSIVLSEKAAQTLFDNPLNCVGKIVKVGNGAFTVVGVYKHEWTNNCFIPFSTARALKGYEDKFNSINVHIQGVTTEKESGAVEKQVREALASTEKFDPSDDSAVWTYDRFASYIESMRAGTFLNVAMWTIGILTLVTGIVGVSNIMFVSVRERTHEIGIRRAIGAKPRNILSQVILESVALTTCFGYIGIVMGTLATEIVKKVFADSDFMLNPTVDLSIAIEVTIALIISGALAGIFPALRALKVKPVEALRDE